MTVTLLQGDCLEILPTLADKSVDAVITDPPFGIDFKYESHDDDPSLYAEFMRRVVSEAQRIAGDRLIMFWQAMPNADKWHNWFPAGFRLFAACKGFVQYRPTPIQYSWDPVVFWGKSKVSPSVYNKDFHVNNLAPFGAHREKIDHPCPRPLPQVEYIIERFTCEGDTILDPFMGSGTTGVACVRLGRNFIGIEKEQKYFEIAQRRTEEAQRQIVMPL